MQRTFQRNITLGRAAEGDDAIPATLATDAPVPRWGILEQLDCTPAGCDLSRAPLPVLVQHNADQLAVGIAEDVHATGRKVRARIRFGASALAQEVKRDVLAGIHRSLSVAYELLDDGRRVAADTWKFRWRPFETSIVSVPADVGAGFFRHKDIVMTQHDNLDTAAGGEFDNDEQQTGSRLSRSQRRAAAEAAAQSERAAERATIAEQRRCSDIRVLGENSLATGAASWLPTPSTPGPPGTIFVNACFPRRRPGKPSRTPSAKPCRRVELGCIRCRATAAARA